MGLWCVLIICTAVFTQCAAPQSLPREKASDENRNSDKYSYFNWRPMDFQAAKEACANEQRTLPFSSSVTDYAQLITFIQNQRFGYTLWLQPRQQVFSKWIWVSYSQYADLPPLRQRMECGFLDYTAPNLRKTKCSALWLGYICQAQTAECHNFRAGAKQIKIGQKCFRVSFEEVNWYEARWRCHLENMDLAVIQNREEETQLKNALSKWKIFNRSQFWIGFHNADWYIKDGVKDSITNHSVFWDWGQPSHRGRCAMVKRKTHLWRSASCSEKHHVICQQKPLTTTELQHNEHSTNPTVPAWTAKVDGKPLVNRKTHLQPDSSTVWLCILISVLLSEHIRSLATTAHHEGFQSHVGN